MSLKSNDLKLQANDLFSIQLSDRQLCDLELILNGAFNPLKGFINKKNYMFSW